MAWWALLSQDSLFYDIVDKFQYSFGWQKEAEIQWKVWIYRMVITIIVSTMHNADNLSIEENGTAASSLFQFDTGIGSEVIAADKKGRFHLNKDSQ